MKAQLKFYLPETSEGEEMPEEISGDWVFDILFDYVKPEWLNLYDHNMIIHHKGEIFRVMDVDFNFVED